ncbi:MerR family transcriptional regulator [Arthrobacter woluwensis]|uniref:MerR family transcriptional regulator n=1 Tax=Arthrobacter woluwensis TaxID=156980 RepID=UPI001FB87A49|nr:MerR family transcriptional regulator [Arthrobacter woluwensis]
MKVKTGGILMRIGELAAASGVSARALRHYEEQGVLSPARTSAGYRDYAASDVVRVQQIRTMIAAGVGTATIRRYLDCLRDGGDGVALELCQDLRAELDGLADRLTAQEQEIQGKRQRLRGLLADG